MEVNFKLNLFDVDFNLQALYNYKVFTNTRSDTDKLGFGGILVINGIGIENINLYAFDLSCPVEAKRNIRVQPDNEGYCTCPECGTKYYIGNGSGRPENGESGYLLRPYRIIDTGNYSYRVVN